MLKRVFVGVLMLIVLTVNALAQSGSSSTDGSTPLGLAPGAPAGSFSLSGFESVNLYNGNLNFRLPLLGIAGRGAAAYTMTLALDAKGWDVISRKSNNPDNQGTVYVPRRQPGFPTPGYGPGVLFGRRAFAGEARCPQNGSLIFKYSLTRLTFVTPDGTEFELHDALTDGQPHNYAASDPCTASFSRGTVFIAADGSAATFVSDAPILEDRGVTLGPVMVSGTLLFKNGTRYRVDNGLVKAIRDRNGNQLRFSYDAQNRVKTITDALKRQVRIEYQVQDVAPFGVCDRIIYKGFGGAERIIRITRYSPLANSLRNDQVLKKVNGLFPELSGASEVLDYNPNVVSAVWLPDGRAYRLLYNSYGELARVELPTSGAFEYDMNAGSGVMINSVGSVFKIYRQVKDRRVYAENNTLQGRSTYSTSYGPNPSNDGDATTVRVDAFGAGGERLTREKHYFYGNAQTSLLESNSLLFYPEWREGREYRTELFDKSGATVLRQMDNTFAQRAPVPWWLSYASQNGLDTKLEPANDLRLIESKVKLADSNQVSRQVFGYDRYNNMTDMRAYDFNGVLARRMQISYVKTNNGVDYARNLNIHLRDLVRETSIYDAAGVVKARTTLEYDNYAADGLHAPLLARPGISGLQANYTTSYLTRGNVTQTTLSMLPAGGQISTYSQYDMAGNVVRTMDGRGIKTAFEYTDRFGLPDGEAQTHTAPAELGGDISYALATMTTVGEGLAIVQTSQTQYDYYSAVSVDTQNANGVVASARYDDVLDRPTQLVLGTNTPLRRQTSFIYNDTLRMVVVRSDQEVFGDNKVRAETYFDGLGRIIDSRTYESGGGYISQQTKYDGLGRVVALSNPYRPGEPVLWATTEYEGLGRAVRITGPDGAQSVLSYFGSEMTVTDEAGKVKRSASDALGRLVLMVEDPSALNYQTDYQYDVLDNLMTVTQGTQTRTFGYDSLKRLLEANNPESGRVTFQYDNNSNLIVKTDGRGVTVSFAYDGLDRLTQKNYSDGTPTVTYSYDDPTVPNSKGLLTAVSSSVSSYKYTGYDALGRVTASQQNTNGQSYAMSYEYDLAGNLRKQRYPSGREVSSSVDALNRVTSLTGQKAGEAAKTYASGISFAAHGGVKALQLGNSLWEHTNYNDRPQAVEIGLGTGSVDSSLLKLEYGYGGVNNNGNLLSQKMTAPGLSLTQTYSYDGVNRLKTASEGTNWQQVYEYDRWGNRAVTGYLPNPAQTPQSLTAFNAKNQLVNGLYEGAGNLTRDLVGNKFTYDAENRQKTYTAFDPSVVNATYEYDGDGQRVKKVVGTETTVFVYNASGQLVGEYSTGTVTGAGGTSYLTADTLGSTRVLTDGDGKVKTRYDYMPFGEELAANIGGRSGVPSYGTLDSTRQKFTQKERDNESGLDYFLARYYSSAQGRFTSSDPLLGSGTVYDPQTWNRYTYTLNNPLKYIDPFGLYVFDSKATGDEKKKFRNALKDLERARNAFKNKKGSEEYERINRALTAYGMEGVDNGVTIIFGATKEGSPAATEVGIKLDPANGSNKIETADNKIGQDTRVTIDPNKNTSPDDYVFSAGHEGSHVADGSELIRELPTNLTTAAANAVLDGSLNLTKYVTETRAYEVTSFIAQGRGGGGNLTIGRNKIEIWNSGWSKADKATKQSAGRPTKLSDGIDKVLADPSGYYKVTPTNQGAKLIPR